MALNSLDAILDWFLEQSRTGSPNFFDSELVKGERKRPSYHKSLHRQISKLIGAGAFETGNGPRFKILEAEQVTEGADRRLEMIGEYEVFDGVRIDVAFSGVYASQTHGGISKFFEFRPGEAFNSVTLEARLVNADERQRAMFSSIVPVEGFHFRDGVLRYKKEGKTWFTGEKEAEAGLVKVAHVGVIAAWYEALHSREAVIAIGQKYHAFVEALAAIDENPQNVEFAVNAGLSITKKGYARFLPFARFETSLEENTPGIVRTGRTVKPLFNVTISYSTQLARDDGSWNVKVEGQLMKMIQAASDAHFNDLALPSPIEKVTSTLEFIEGALGLMVYDPQDYRDSTYTTIFDDCLLNARKEVKIEQPDYEPLVLTFGESNIHLVHEHSLSFWKEDEKFEFRTLSSYHVFEALMALVRGSPLIEVDSLVSNEIVQNRLARDPALRRRFMAYFDCYKQDPVTAWRLYVDRDPAVQIARKLEEQYHRSVEAKG